MNRLEQNTGIGGLKFDNVSRPETANTLSQETKTILFNKLKYSQDSNWSELVNRLVQGWKLWGDSYGYFNRKSDTLSFGEQIQQLVEAGVFLPSQQQLQLLGIRAAYGQKQEDIIGHFADPETGNIVTSDDRFLHPFLHEDNQATISGVVNGEWLNSLNNQELSHAARLIMTALDISIQASRFATPELATLAWEQRPVSLTILGNAANIERFYEELVATSAELAKVITPTQDTKTISYEYEVSRATQSLVKSAGGIRNQIKLNVEEKKTLEELWEVKSNQASGISRQEIKKKTNQETAEVRSLQSEILTAQPTATSNQQSELNNEKRSQAVPGMHATYPGLVHRFKIAETGFTLIPTLGEELEIIDLMVIPDDYQYYITVNYLLLKSITLNIKAGLSLTMLRKEFAVTTFAPAGKSDNPEISEVNSVVDYMLQWIENYSKRVVS